MSFGRGKSVRLTFIKKLVARIDDIMISQKAFIERLQNFDLEFWIHKGWIQVNNDFIFKLKLMNYNL